MDILVKFGSVFRYKEKEYVFLARVDDIIYAAEILTKEYTQKVNSLYEAKVKNNSIEKVKKNALYCFVILDSEEFKGRMAHFAKTDTNSADVLFDIIATLNQKDLQEIKEEILAEDSPVPLRLKEVVKEIA
jgi:hypothetical protein